MVHKVLMFGWEFPPHNSGGLGVACYGLAKALLETAQVELTFVLPQSIPMPDLGMDVKFADKVTGVNLKFRHVDTLLTAYITPQEYASKLIGKQNHIYGTGLYSEVQRYALLAEQIALETEFDVIHAHDWLSFGAGIVAKRVSGKPLVLHVHATEVDRTGGHGVNDFVFEIEKEAFAEADKILTVSAYTKSVVMDYYGIAASKIEVVHNGIDYGNAASSELQMTPEPNVLDGLEALRKAGHKLVLFLGRFTIQKGADTFIYAAHRVLEYVPNAIFLMVGAGDMEKYLIELSARLGCSDKIVFTGFLRGGERERAYQAADLFVMPSISEPFGLVALEALLENTPVIISKQSGVAEVVPNALKVDFWDVDELVNQMVSILKNESLGNVLVTNGKQDALRSTWRKAADKCIQVYNNVIAAKQKVRSLT